MANGAFGWVHTQPGHTRIGKDTIEGRTSRTQLQISGMVEWRIMSVSDIISEGLVMKHRFKNDREQYVESEIYERSEF